MGLGLLDTYLAYKFIKMLATPWKKMEAYKLGIIDKKGKRIRTEKADDAARNAGSKYTNIHKVIFNIKRLIGKVPGGKSRLGGAAAAIWLLKEEAKKAGVNDEQLIEDIIIDHLKTYGYIEDNEMNEAFSKLDIMVPSGTYIIFNKLVLIKEDLDSFDKICDIPLFRVGELVFSKDNIEGVGQ